MHSIYRMPKFRFQKDTHSHIHDIYIYFDFEMPENSIKELDVESMKRELERLNENCRQRISFVFFFILMLLLLHKLRSVCSSVYSKQSHADTFG